MRKQPQTRHETHHYGMAHLGPVVATLAMASLGACATSGVVVTDEGVEARGQTGQVSAAVGPDDAGVAYAGDRVVAGVGTDHQAAVGVRVDDSSPAVVGLESLDRGGMFGGLTLGF